MRNIVSQYDAFQNDSTSMYNVISKLFTDMDSSGHVKEFT